jgi:hypothetical protein
MTVLDRVVGKRIKPLEFHFSVEAYELRLVERCPQQRNADPLPRFARRNVYTVPPPRRDLSLPGAT